MIDPRRIEQGRSAPHSMHDVVLVEQELRQVGPILTRDTCDESSFHKAANVCLLLARASTRYCARKCVRSVWTPAALPRQAPFRVICLDPALVAPVHHFSPPALVTQVPLERLLKSSAQ